MFQLDTYLYIKSKYNFYCGSFSYMPRSSVGGDLCSICRGTKLTRRYPWGIQRLVSTHQFPPVPDQLNPKCQGLHLFVCVGWGWGVGDLGLDQLNQSAKICPNLHLGGGCWWSRPTQPKCQDLSKCTFGGGGGWFRPTFLKYLSGGHSRNFEHKFCHGD